MKPEENPPKNLSHPSSQAPAEPDRSTTPSPRREPVEAMLADALPVPISSLDDDTPEESQSDLKVDQMSKDTDKFSPQIHSKLENMAATGGAVGALVLGIMAFSGSFITSFSIINGVIGLLMGVWGLGSRKRKMAWIGIGFCSIGIILSLANVSSLIGEFLNATQNDKF